MRGTINARDVRPSGQIPFPQAFMFEYSGSAALSVNDVIVLEGENNGVPQYDLADASAIATTKGALAVSLSAGSSTDTYGKIAVPWRFLTGVDTSGGTALAPIYLSDTAGEWSLTAGTVERVIGQVIAVSATEGVVLLDPAGVFASMVGTMVGWRDAIIADSSAVTNTTAETAFDATLAVPANVPGSGQTLKFRAVVRFTATNGADTALLRLRAGGEDVVVSSAVDVADDDTCVLEGYVTFRAAAGTAVDVEGGGIAIFDTGAAGTISTATGLADATTLDTTAAVTLDVTITWSAASTANSAKLVHLSAELI